MEPVQHECGRSLQKMEQPEMFDATSINDVPEHLHGISFDRLPRQYHKFIQIGTFTYWFDNGGPVEKCPQCGEQLEIYRRSM